MAVFTDAGMVIDNLPAIRARLQAATQLAFSDIVPVGEEMSVDDSSVMGRIIGVVSEVYADYEEALQQLYASKDINQATGQQLELLCALGGVYRQDASPAQAMLMLYGTYGTIIPVSTNVSSRITGDVFTTSQEVTLNSTSVNGSEYAVEGVGAITTYSIKWAVDNDNNTNEPISITSLSTDSVEQICAKLIANTTTDRVSVYKTNDNKFGIYFTNRNDTGTFTVSNLTVKNIYKPVDSVCTVLGQHTQDRDTLTNIQTPVLGWLGVTNPFDAVDGTDEQTDEELRLFYHDTKVKEGGSTYSAMYGALRAIRGVRFVNIQENTLDVTINGIPSHTIAVVILGGDENLIGQAILDNIPVGIGTYGDISNVATDVNDNPITVKFARPDLVPIAIHLTLATYPDFPDNGTALIRQALVDYIAGFNVGDDVLYSRLFTPINGVRGFAVNSLTIGKVGFPLTSSNITLGYKELANISFADITFG